MSNDFYYNYRFIDDDKVSRLPAGSYDDPNKNPTRSAYRGIIYDESIIQKVLDSFEDALISPLHDPDDDHTKPHWHVMVNFGRNGQRYRTILEQFHKLGIVGCQYVENKISTIKYYAHRTAASKYKQQFSDETIRFETRCSDPDKLSQYIKVMSGIDPVISDYDQLFQIVNSHHFLYYIDLLDFLRKMDSGLYLFACRNSNFCVKLLRSREYKINKIKEFSR